MARGEELVGELLVAGFRVPGVKHGFVDVGGPVVKGGEQEAHVRRGHHPILLPLMELVFAGEIAQGGLGGLHRADGAEDILEHFLRRVVHPYVVPALEGHVVTVAEQENQIIGLHLQGGNDPGKKILHRFLVLQSRFPRRCISALWFSLFITS